MFLHKAMKQEKERSIMLSIKQASIKMRSTKKLHLTPRRTWNKKSMITMSSQPNGLKKRRNKKLKLKSKIREAALSAKSAAQHTQEVADRSERVAEQKVRAFIEKTYEEAQHSREAAKLKELKAEKKAEQLSEQAADAEMRAQEAARHLEEVSNLRIVSADT